MTQYLMSGYELGTYMEVYLPKRAIYQPVLFEVLTKGFEIEHVRRHFLCGRKRPGILKLLGGNPAWNNYDDPYVNQLRPFFYGYSMYEVDGVFKGSTDAVIEERTQILRLIFRLDLDEIIREAKVEEENRRDVRARISDYLRAHNRDHVIDNASGSYRRICEAAKTWRDQLGFFVFGYILYELCTHIEQLHEQGRVNKIEDELWVTQFANLELDRVLSPFADSSSRSYRIGEEGESEPSTPS